MFRAALLLCLYGCALLLPFGICVDFVMEKERIARDLCVQRAVPGEQRTCHGQCHLAKQLKKAEGTEHQRESALPDFRFEVQFLVAHGAQRLIAFQPAKAQFAPARDMATCSGFVRCSELVPWA